MNDFKMRRQRLQTTDEQAKAILSAGSYGIFSTVGDDGFPYGVPVNYIYDGKKIYFHCAKNAGHKLHNLDFCNKVCFTVVTEGSVIPSELDTKYQSVVVFGTAERTNEQTAVYALKEIVKKHAPAFIKEGDIEIEKVLGATDVIAITPLKISGKQKHI